MVNEEILLEIGNYGDNENKPEQATCLAEYDPYIRTYIDWT